MNTRWHKRRKMRERLEKNIESSLKLSIDPNEFDKIYTTLKTQGVVSSRRDLARQAGVSSTTIDSWLSAKNVNAKTDTIEKLTKFCLPHLQKAWRNYSEGDFLDMILSKNKTLRRDMRRWLRDDLT